MPSSRYPKGITNVAVDKTLGEMPVLDNSTVIRYFEDFTTHSDILLATPTSHTVTKVGTGTLAYSSADGAGGVLKLTNSAADDDSLVIQHKCESFKYVSGKAWSIKTRCKLSDATQSDMMIGVAITDTTVGDATDYIAFGKSDGSPAVTVVLVKNGLSTLVGLSLMSDNTWVVLGARYVPKKQAVEFLVNEVVVASTTTLTNLCDDEELTPTIWIQNGEAVAKSLYVDYLDICFER